MASCLAVLFGCHHPSARTPTRQADDPDDGECVQEPSDDLEHPWLESEARLVVPFTIGLVARAARVCRRTAWRPPARPSGRPSP
jgi:hypothetical protein